MECAAKTVAALLAALAIASPGRAELAADVLGPGDRVRVAVFQVPELTTETRVSERGTVTLPLAGEIEMAGLTPAQAAARVAEQLKRGGFIVNPQVTVAVLEVRSRQVTVLGHVNKPGKIALDDASYRLTDILALAGGISAGGADNVTILVRRSDLAKREVDLPAMIRNGDLSDNLKIESGDTVFVQRAPVFYIYGEVQRAGAYRLEPNMIVMQALALSGGITPRGTERGMKIRRQAPDGRFESLNARPDDRLQPNDVVYVRESLF